VSKVDIYNITEENLLETLEALASGSTQGSSAYHTRGDVQKQAEKKAKKNQDQYNLLMSQIAALDAQLKELNLKLDALVEDEQKIRDALKQNALNQTQINQELEEKKAKQAEAENNVKAQEEEVKKAENDLTQAKEEYTDAVAHSDETLEQEEKAWELISEHEDVLENSDVISIRHGGFERKTVYEDEKGYYVIIYHEDPEGQAVRVTDPEEIKAIDAQKEAGKRAGNDPALSPEEQTIVDKHIALRKMAEGHTDVTDEAVVEENAAEEKLVQATLCYENAEKALENLQKIRDDITSEVMALNEEAKALRDKQEKLEGDLGNNLAQQEAIKQKIAEIEAKKAELETQMNDVADIEHKIEHGGDGACVRVDVSGKLESRLSAVFGQHASGEDTLQAAARAKADNNTEKGNAEIDTFEIAGPDLLEGENFRKMNNLLTELDGYGAISAERLKTMASGHGFDVSDKIFHALQQKLEDVRPDLNVFDPNTTGIAFYEGGFRAAQSTNTMTFGAAASGTPAPTDNTPAPGTPGPTLQNQFGMNTV
jgi:chromosome segregation ATPase